jgi:O-Antigen ligase
VFPPTADNYGSRGANGLRSRFETRPPTALRRQNITLRQDGKRKASWPVFLFLMGLIVPWTIPVGPLRMSAYRIVLIAMILPSLRLWASGKAGRIRFADIALLSFWFWCALSLIVNNGLGSTIHTIGISFIETMGSYFLARCYIRDADDFYNMVQILFRIVAFLLPFAIIECLTGQNILRDLFSAIMPTLPPPGEPGRWGLSRAYVIFDHEILFGVFCGSMLALSHQVLGYKKTAFQRALRIAIIGATTFSSLSAGAIIVLALQAFLILWNWLFRTVKFRWRILVGFLIVAYLFVGLVANRSALDIVTNFFVFDPMSYWYRKLIWDYGWASVMMHPLFGVGLNDWERPTWMPASIDNFWLLSAISYGLPATVLILTSVFSVLGLVSLKKGLNERRAAYRMGFVISLVAFTIVLFTVAVWNAAYVFFFFLLGSGLWMVDDATRLEARSRVRAGD